MPGNLEGQSIRLEVISGQNLNVPSERIPAGIYVSIELNSTRRWKSTIRVLSSDKSVTWGGTATLSSHASPTLSMEIRASFELGRTLGNGELIGNLETSWDDLLDHGDEPFDLSFPPVRGVHPYLTLKVASVHACGNEDSEAIRQRQLQSIIDCELTQRTDAGHTRFAEYMASKTVSHLNDAVENFQSGSRAVPGAALTNLAWSRLRGYIRDDLEDIDSTTSVFRDALALPLNWRHSRECTVVDIHESVRLCRKLLALCPEGTYLRRIGVDCAVDYVICTCNNLPIDGSDEGIQLRRLMLELCPPSHQHRPRALNKLSSSLDTRFSQRGDIDDIDESIQLCREAVALCPEGHPHRDTKANLKTSMRPSLCSEEALHLRPVGHNIRPLSLGNLGGALIDCFNQRGDINDLNRAISLHREALALCPPGHHRRDATLNNLALALDTRYDKLDASDDLNEAIDLYRESLRLKQHDHSERHINLLNLSSALCSRFTRTSKNEDVEEAIALCQESLAALPSPHPDRHFSYMKLQEAYLSRFRVQHNPADLSFAVENFRLASTHPTQGFPNRINGAINWTFAAERHDHASAQEAYKMFFELLDRHLATRSSVVARREAAAAFCHGNVLPVDAASCAIRRDSLRKAIELVEQGRGQQWSLASRLRTPLEDLKITHPKLTDTFSELSKHISDAQGRAVGADRAAADRAAIEYRRLTEQWDAAVAEIRNVQGFSQFLLPPSYDDLQVAARHGPVIFLIASKYSCNAVIVPKSGEPHHVPFPSLALADLKMLKVNFARAIRHASHMGPKEPRKDLVVLLRRIWDEIMLPIVKVLMHDLKVKPRSRIWLCPTAAFTSIPLHAAHPSRTKADDSGRELCLEDIYIVSYTPTLSALIRARKTMKTRATLSFVAIGQSQPGAGQGEALLTVDSELELVHKLVPPNATFTSLSGDEATRAGALDALRRNTWVHLACHGKQDREQPYHSRFSMRDEPLTLLDIMENDAPQAEFAFLSACHTAVGDEETPDEVIHLAAGLQFSGFKSVIGTLWVVDDDVAKHVVEAFYTRLFKGLEDGGIMDCTKAASALNHATYTVKNKVPLEQRIVFVHVGV
ncbi:CHAT domain-containing protein [Suillus ampliporus]|nr:CHAT domain-containing protein [Suillus ampliporus]